jgi:hypothetical protein
MGRPSERYTARDLAASVSVLSHRIVPTRTEVGRRLRDIFQESGGKLVLPGGFIRHLPPSPALEALGVQWHDYSPETIQSVRGTGSEVRRLGTSAAPR